MSDELPENKTVEQTGDALKEIGPAGLPHPETDSQHTETASQGLESVSEEHETGSVVSETAAVEPGPAAVNDQSAAVVPNESKSPASYKAVKLLSALMVLIVFAFMSIGFGESPYTSRHWVSAIASGGGLLPKLFSRDYKLTLRAAVDTIMAEFARNNSNDIEAQRYYSRALIAYKAINAEDTVCGYMCLDGLAKSFNDDKKYADAQSYWQSALPVAQKVYGKEHEVVAANLRELAFCTTKLRQFDKSEEFYSKALKLDRKGLGDKHFDVAYDMSCVGEMAYLQKDYPKAIKFLSESIPIYIAARGEFHPSYSWVEESLAKAYYESSMYAEAARQFETVLEKSDRLHGVAGREYLRELAWLTWSYYYDGNKERAILRAKKLKGLLDARDDRDVGAMVDVLESNADIFMLLDDYSQAASCFERFMKIEKMKGNTDDLKLSKVIYSLIRCYEKIGRKKEADELKDRMSRIELNQFSGSP